MLVCLWTSGTRTKSTFGNREHRLTDKLYREINYRKDWSNNFGTGSCGLMAFVELRFFSCGGLNQIDLFHSVCNTCVHHRSCYSTVTYCDVEPWRATTTRSLQCHISIPSAERQRHEIRYDCSGFRRIIDLKRIEFDERQSKGRIIIFAKFKLYTSLCSTTSYYPSQTDVN